MKKSNKDLIYVSIVEDKDRFRNVFRFIINNADGLKCISDYSDCESAITGLIEDNPDVILMDIELGDGKLNGIEAVKILKEKLPKTDILMLTVYEDYNEFVYNALCAGANGYLTKDTSPENLVESIKQVYNGGAPMSPAIAKKVVSAFSSVKNNESILSEQEKKILTLTSEDKVDKEIADLLSISRETVRFHFKNIYEKLQVHSKHGAVAKAIKKNLL